MPRGRKPEGEQALSNAERQARYRDRHPSPPMPGVIRRRAASDRRSRPQRWRDAVAALLTLQAEYATWLDALRDTPTAQALQDIVDLDVTTLAEAHPPRGYGRD